MEFTQRDALLGVGIGAVFSARHFYRAKKLWPFRISVIVAWPAIGVAIMQTVIGNSTPQNVRMLQESPPSGHLLQESEEVEKTRAANAAFLERMRSIADRSKQ